MRTWILGILLTLAGLVLFLGLCLLGYHLTGRWAFNRWKAERVAMGDRFELKELVPPSLEPSQNFAEAPLVKGAVLGKGQVNGRFKTLALNEGALKALGNWQEGRRDDLDAVLRAYGTRDLQSVFKPLEPIIKELDQASRRPGCRLPVAYEQGEIPALLGFRAAVRTLRVRAVANLRGGRPDLALDDLMICLRIADHLKAEPALISALLRVAVLNISLQVAWEGLEDHLWTPPQLGIIQVELSKIDLLATSKLAWQMERQFMITSQAALAEGKPWMKAVEAGEKDEKPIRMGMLGKGWVYRNLLEYCRYLTTLVDTQDPGSHRVYPTASPDADQWVRRLRFRPDLVIARIAIPALGGQTVRFARTQALIDEGMVACALERHRLEKGHDAVCLEDLMPSFLQRLPRDLVTGGPLIYKRNGNHFQLYQVGWDGVDQGGAPGWTQEGAQRRVDPAKGDWGWPHVTP